jgi:hypothetical protein
VDRPFAVQFGGNRSYTSIDHEYDHLWGEDGNGYLLVHVPDKRFGEEPRAGVISMYVVYQLWKSGRTEVRERLLIAIFFKVSSAALPVFSANSYPNGK